MHWRGDVFEALSALIDPLVPLAPLVMLVSLRVGVAFAAMPSPLGGGAPVQSRAVLGFLVGVAIVLPRTQLAEGMSLDPYWLAYASLGEVLVGSVIGLTVRVTVAAVEAAGAFVGFSAGLAFAQSVDPTFGESNSPPARLLGAFAVLLFFVLQGHHAVLAALGHSLDFARPGHALAVVDHEGVLRLGARMVAQGLRIAAPVVGTMFLVQLGLALLSRAAPKVHLFSLSFAVAVSAGILTLFFAAPSLAPAIAQEIHDLPAALSAALGVR